MGRMPREVWEGDGSLPHSGEAARFAGMGIREEPQCKQDSRVMPDRLCGPGVAPEEWACVCPRDGA